MMNDDTARLDEADACHDADPSRAAALLHAIEAAQLAADRLPGLGFLLNHVLGEKLGNWRDAHARQAALLGAAGAAPAPVLFRQAAAAAQAAGAADDARRLAASLADAASAPEHLALEVVALTVAMYRVPALDAAAAADCTRDALHSLRGDAEAWNEPGPFDTSAAACINNIASNLVERPADAFAHAPLRDALHDAAQLAERFWLRAGNWIHHERAAYLRAMAANALAQAPQAREHALRALALIDANDIDDNERVDRAFIELEHAHACRALELIAEAQTAQARADAIAAAFSDASLDDWFASRRRALAMLAARGG